MSKIYFDAYEGLIFKTTHQFYIWSYLFDSEKRNSVCFDSIAFSNTLTISLMQSFLLNIANLFDARNKKNTFSIYSLLHKSKNLSISKLINNEIKKFSKTIKALKGWRDKFLAHKEVKFVKNPNLLYSKFAIDDLELEKMIQFLIDVLDLIKKDFDPNNSKNYSHFYSSIKKSCINHAKFASENGWLKKV